MLFITFDFIEFITLINFVIAYLMDEIDVIDNWGMFEWVILTDAIDVTYRIGIFRNLESLV